MLSFLFFGGAALNSFGQPAEQWIAGPNLSQARSYFALVQLPSGDFLAAGGLPNGSGYSNKVDKYSLASGLFTAVPDMPFVHRHPLQALLLPNGKFLIAGEHPNNLPYVGHLYTESSNAWSSTGLASLDRFSAAMALLPNGKVLYAGGYVGGDGPTYNSAELFDPSSSSFSATGAMTAQRFGLTLTVLSQGLHAGKALAVGGGVRTTLSAEKRCELYNPATGSFSLTGPLNVARLFHTATLLADGRVLVTGGHTAGLDQPNLASAELYDPQTGTWSLTAPMAFRRARHTATLLPSGEVLIVGGSGQGNLSQVTGSAEIFDPATATFRTITAMASPRTYHAAALLPDGRVLVAGGYNGSTMVASSTLLVFPPPNQPPTADAGQDFELRPGSLASLDGSASTDDATPAGELLFSWSFTARPVGSLAVLANAGTSQPAFTPDLPGDYRLSLVVEDGDGAASQPDEAVVTANVAPTAAISPSSTVAEVGSWVELDGLASADPENAPLTYSWSLEEAPAGSSASLVDPTAAQTSLQLDLPGEYRVRLAVSDSLGQGQAATVELAGILIPIVEVPTLGAYGRLALAAALALIAVLLLPRR